MSFATYKLRVHVDVAEVIDYAADFEATVVVLKHVPQHRRLSRSAGWHAWLHVSACLEGPPLVARMPLIQSEL